MPPPWRRADMKASRRLLLQALALAGLAACSPSPRRSFARGGIVALDWALAETLVAMGHPPSGVVAAGDWTKFVVEPELPASVADLGLQQEVNLELVSALRPELILISPFLDHLGPTLERIAPTLNLSVYEGGEFPLANRKRITWDLGDRIGIAGSAERLITEVETQIAQAAHRLHGLAKKPVLLASFVDNRHARVYGGSSLYAEVLALLGLDNAWTRPVGYFGFTTVGIEELAALGEIELVAIAPIPPDIARALASSPLWTELPFVRSGSYGLIPPVFMFGSLPAAERTARLLTSHLLKQWA